MATQELVTRITEQETAGANVLCDAIRSRQLLHLFYNGGYRTVEPYVFGPGRQGPRLLRVYQREGYSQSGQPSGWKMMRVDQIANLSVLPDRFAPRPDYNPHDPAISGETCRIPETPPERFRRWARRFTRRIRALFRS